MSAPESHDDEDVEIRRLLEASPASTSAAHDFAVLKAARAATRIHSHMGRWQAPMWATAAAILVLLIIGAVWRAHISHRQLADSHTPTAQTHPSARVAMVLSPVLSPGLTRGSTSDLPRLSIPAGTRVVRLRIDVSTPNGPGSYALSVATRSGKQVWSGAISGAESGTSPGILLADLPAAALASGEYELTLRATKDGSDSAVDYYYFETHRE